MPKITVPITTNDDFIDSSRDYGVISITPYLQYLLADSLSWLRSSRCDYIETFDYSLEPHLEDEDATLDCPTWKMGSDGDLHWEGYYKNTQVSWSTALIPREVWESEEDADLREECDIEEEKEEREDEN